tara:strand:+ start:135 stop:281 length:147 start_codon:yes stop_codon:yes gene_type:complete
VVVKVVEMITNLRLVVVTLELVVEAVEPVEMVVEVIAPLVVMVDQVLL